MLERLDASTLYPPFVALLTMVDIRCRARGAAYVATRRR